MPDMKTDVIKDPFVTSARTNTSDVKAPTSNILDGIEAPMKFADIKAATTKIPTCNVAPSRTPGVRATPTSIPDIKTATTNIRLSNFCKDHRDKIELPDPHVVEDLISDNLNNRRK